MSFSFKQDILDLTTSLLDRFDNGFCLIWRNDAVVCALQDLWMFSDILRDPNWFVPKEVLESHRRG